MSRVKFVTLATNSIITVFRNVTNEILTYNINDILISLYVKKLDLWMEA